MRNVSPSLSVRLAGAVLVALLVTVVAARAAGGGSLVWSPPIGIPGLGQATQLMSASCPSTTLCVVSGTAGTAVSTDPTGGEVAWSALPFIGLIGVSCPSATLCVGVAPGAGTSGGTDHIYATADPAGGQSTWHGFAIPHAAGQFWAGISCGSPSLCVAYESGAFHKGFHVSTGGHVMVSTDPAGGATAWKLTSLRDVVDSADCTGRFCLLGTLDGALLTSNDPTSQRWRTVPITGGHAGLLSALDDVACATSSYCLVAAEQTPLVWYSRDPASAGSWRRLSAITALAGDGAVGAAGCMSSGRCVLAVDELTRASNTAELISSPSPGAKWRGVRVAGQYFGASCPSEAMCVAAGSRTYNDSSARVIVGQSAP